MMVFLAALLMPLICVLAAPTVPNASVPPFPVAPRRDPPLALVGGRIVTHAGDAPLEHATLLVRDGRIEAVGADLPLPFDARAVDVGGLLLTPALLDALQQRDLSFPESAAMQGRPYDAGRDVVVDMPDGYRRGLLPERTAWRALAPDTGTDEDRQAEGFAAVFIAPHGELLSGAGAWLALSARPPREALLDAEAAQLCSLEWRTGPENYQGYDYPATLMGVMAHLRQILLDAQRQALMGDRHARDSEPYRGVQDPALAALEPVLRGERLLVVEARDEEDIRLALGLQEDFPGLKLAIAGGTEAYELADELARRGIAVIHDLHFGKEPADPDHPDDKDDQAVAKAGAKAEAETGEKSDAEQGAAAEVSSVELSPSAAKAGNVTPPWELQPPLRVQRDRHERWLERVSGVATLHAAGVTLAFGSFDRAPDEWLEDLRVALEHGGLTPDVALAALTSGPRAIFGERLPQGTLEPGAAAMVTAWEGEPLTKDGKARVLVIDGILVDLRERSEGGDEDEDKDAEADDAHAGGADEAGTGSAAEPGGADLANAARVPAEDAAKPAALWPVELDSDRAPEFRTGGDVLVRGATILTVSHGTLPNSDLLVRDGKIAVIGEDLAAPEGVRVIDAHGQFLMPGIIDCHAHVAIRGGINEWTRSITPECTIEDEVDPDDVDIYRALAGGVTSARLLHGSANTIGGRHEVIKLRWGKSAPELVFEGAPRGVKFALGENPRQSNGGSGERFPRSRMGVEAVLRRSFDAAAAYRSEWTVYDGRVAAGEGPDPPRRDLRLEALSGILDGSTRIHSHCYQADEILMLLRVAEDFGLRVTTLQHVLEGYKVAAEIAAHGAGGSTFVDWWGYKFEAYDATPYCAALMREAGVLMSVNSDSDEHLRRLYLEAAKTVKYGGVPEDAALAMVTLNPAIQLGIDQRVGSIDVGKDADFALFNRHPFDVRTQCRMTFVDGELYFQRRDGLYDEWHAGVAQRIAAARAERAVAAEAQEAAAAAGAALDNAAAARGPEAATAAGRAALEARTRKQDPAVLAALDLPRDATRCATTPERPAGPAIALVGGRVHTMERDEGGLIVHDPGVVVMDSGRVRGVWAGTDVPGAGSGLLIVDCSGFDVWPGLVDAGCTLGLVEIDSVAGTQDQREIGTDQPDLRASAAWRADSEHIAVARVNGTTTAIVVPEGGRVAGQSSAMALEGWTAAEAVVKDAVALHVSAPRTERDTDHDDDGPPVDSHGATADRLGADLCAGGPAFAADDDAEDEPEDKDKDKPLSERLQENWRELRTMFADAREYVRVQAESVRRGVPGPEHDPRLQSLAPYALGVGPVVFEADWADQIMDALDFARAEGLRPIIAGGHEAWKVADRLALDDVPVILGPVLALPFAREDLYDAPLQNAAALHAAGVRFSFRSNSSASARDLPYHAGMAVAFGLPEDEALYALTAGAAQILGLQADVGTLAPGRRADVIVTDGSPLQITTTLHQLYIGGRAVPLSTRHTRLYDRFHQRLLDPARPSQ